MQIDTQKQTKKILDQQNIIGSLRGDILKLDQARQGLEGRVKTLRLEVRKQKGLLKKTTRQLQAVKNSASWKTGFVIIKAFAQPGINTLLLPYRLLKILFIRNKHKRSQSTTIQAGQVNTRKYPSPLQASRFSQPNKQFSLRKSITSANLSQLRVASIVDEFTYNCFKPECNLFQLSLTDWQQEITSFKPDLLFVEAAWHGKDDQWIGKIIRTAQETRSLLEWCNKQEIPTAFWAKEDPSDFDAFLNTAVLFDYIFTTDTDCIEKYKKTIPQAKVFLLPFAAQPIRHNPIEKYHRKDTFCFAGAYYDRFPERQKDFSTLYDVLAELKDIDIFDRNYRDNRNLFIFPEKYKKSILGNLPNEQIDKAYKGYRYAININSIKTSPSMFARRVFELLASNTIVVSNYSKGLHLFFKDLVVHSDDKQTLLRCLEPILYDEVYFRKFRLLGLRKVLQEHLYQDRLAYLAETIWKVRPTSLAPILVVCYIKTVEEFAHILETYQRQRYNNTTLLIVSPLADLLAKQQSSSSIQFCTNETASQRKIGDFTTNGFISFWACDDYYGPNYLMDIILATRYSSAQVIGKGFWYKKVGNEIQAVGDKSRYCYMDKLPLRSCIIDITLISNTILADFIRQIPSREMQHTECLSIDEFNYCRDFIGTTCQTVDDLPQIDCGLSMNELLKRS